MLEIDKNLGEARKFSDPIPLNDPIQRGETVIDKLILRKPQAGELRGLSLQDLLTADVSATLTLIPRISDPALAQHEADAMDPADLAECAGVIRGFFMSKAEKARMDAMIAAQASKS